MIVEIVIIIGVVVSLWLIVNRFRRRLAKPLSVNYHFTRECNFQCGFCFHTAKTSDKLSLEEAKHGLQSLKDAGMAKLNFAGGEPLLPKHHAFLGELIRYVKEDLKIESVSVVTNGSFLTKCRDWFAKNGQFIDILAVSCDSVNEETNVKIGRASGGRGRQLEYLRLAKRLCEQYDIKFKINTVVSSYTWQEDMNALIDELQPKMEGAALEYFFSCFAKKYVGVQKVFQVLVLADENDGNHTLRDATKFAITDEQFKAFCERHRHQPSFVPESNRAMKNSYLLLDEQMRFLNCSRGGKEATQVIKSVLIFESKILCC